MTSLKSRYGLLSCAYYLTFIALFISCSSKEVTKEIYRLPVLQKENYPKQYQNGYTELIRRADRALKQKFKSVVDKKIIPPSGDKHDYYSRAVYFWPDPAKKDGKPWIYKDGKYNTESFKQTDHKYYYEAMGAVRDLSLAFNITGKIEYAQKAVDIIKLWFINSKTKMNPNFNFAQGIPGRYSGTPSGIIDSRAILWVTTGLKFIRPSGLFTERDEKKFGYWCKSFLDWLINSEFGKKEAASPNNHATFYYALVAGFASFLNEKKLIIFALKNAEKLIPKHIKPDGSQPLELKRAQAFNYSVFNLAAYIELAEIGKEYGYNLIHYHSRKSGTILTALKFLIENAIVKNNWKYKGKVYPSNIYGAASRIEKLDPDYRNKFTKKILPKIKAVKLTDLYFIY